MQVRLDRRSAGLLLHPTSLPGPFESGDLGPSAFRFVDALAEAKQTWWQVLPLGPAGPGFSPYSASSTFAGDPMLISLERLAEEGLLAPSDEGLTPVEASARIDHGASRVRRRGALDRAFVAFRARSGSHEALLAFAREEAPWAPDYALFAALKRAHGDVAFHAWPEALRRREPDAMAKARRDLAKEIDLELFCQRAFAQQLRALRDHAAARGLGLLGDLPIYVDGDSAEVWAHPELFQVDAAGEPSHVAGVPPDQFSDQGQRWGNPLWDWDREARRGFAFWIQRVGAAFARFDAVRLDHFIGFSRYWAVPREARSAKQGTFHPGPGAALFDALFRALGPVQLVAEDLGVLTDEVRTLRDHFRLPGMSVSLFGFSPDAGAESTRLHNFTARSVAYTGTHDNDTARGWISSPPDDASEATRAAWAGERAFALEYLATTEERFVEDLVRSVLRSASTTAILPVQDVLDLGRADRMNRPGVAEGNWAYRLQAGALEGQIPRLRRLVELYGRAG